MVAGSTVHSQTWLMPGWQGIWSQESLLVGLDVLEEVVELLSGAAGIGRISIGTSSLDNGVGA